MGYVGEIKIFAFDFVPPHYVVCDGRRLDKSRYQLLYLRVGNAFTYDNSDDRSFAIPDLRDRFIRHEGTDISLGQRKGTNEVVMGMNQMPEHNHKVGLEVDNSDGGDEISNTPQNSYLNNNAGNFSASPTTNSFLGGISQENVGSSLPIPIMNKYVKMVFAIRYESDEPEEGIVGQIKIWPNSKTANNIASIPAGWKLCNGDSYSIANEPALASIIGFKYGTSTDGNPKLPDFRNRFAAGANTTEEVGKTGGSTEIQLGIKNLPAHSHQVKLAVNSDSQSVTTSSPQHAFINKNAGPFSQEATEKANLAGINQMNAGGNEPVDITNSSLGINFIISTKGIYTPGNPLFIGEILMYAGYNDHFLTAGEFFHCYGHILPINQNQELFSLLGNRYGQAPKDQFKIPDLRNAIPLCLNSFNESGMSGGANHLKLSPEHLPAHNHSVALAVNNDGGGTKVEIADGILNQNAGAFSTKETENTFLAGITEQNPTEETEPIDLRNPFLSINYFIARKGDFPSHGSNSPGE